MDDPKINWHIMTIINDSEGNGTSFIVTIWIYSEKDRILKIPGIKKYKPINTLPVM